MRNVSFISSLTLLSIVFGSVAFGQDPGAVQQKLVSEYALTQPTADNTDIVTAGAVLVLKKGNIMMVPVSSQDVCGNTYKGGKITQSGVCKGNSFLHKTAGLPIPGMSSAKSFDTRTFVPGEKMWVTKIDVRDDGIVFDLFTDAMPDVRYKAGLKFAFPKGLVPTPEQADTLVAQVFSVQPTDANAQQSAPAPAQGSGSTNTAQAANKPAPQAMAATPQQAAPAAPAGQAAPAAQSADTPLQPIAPPPPPTDPVPATIKPGATPDQVVAAMGQPQKQISLGAKLIYVYKDIKVTFVNNKVTDVQ